MQDRHPKQRGSAPYARLLTDTWSQVRPHGLTHTSPGLVHVPMYWNQERARRKKVSTRRWRPASHQERTSPYTRPTAATRGGMTLHALQGAMHAMPVQQKRHVARPEVQHTHWLDVSTRAMCGAGAAAVVIICAPGATLNLGSMAVRRVLRLRDALEREVRVGTCGHLTGLPGGPLLLRPAP